MYTWWDDDTAAFLAWCPGFLGSAGIMAAGLTRRLALIALMDEMESMVILQHEP